MNVNVTNGEKGWVEIADTSIVTKAFRDIECITATKFHSDTAIPGATGFGSAAASGDAFEYPAGHVIYGECNAVKLHSGRVRAFLR